MKLLTWNLEWKTPRSQAGKNLANQIAALAPEVVCYTEVVQSMLPEGFSLQASADYGYPQDGKRRKVVLWSQQPWTQIDLVGDEALPSGRFVSGVSYGIRFVGVCVPWKDAHVHTGREDRQPWEDHLQYLARLRWVLQRYVQSPEPICLLGDFNQRVPKLGQPQTVFDALLGALPLGFEIATAGVLDAEGRALIDHVIHDPKLCFGEVQRISRFDDSRRALTDHTGVLGSLVLR